MKIMDTSYVIPPVEKSLIKAELNKDIFFRKTNNGSREIYITTAHNSPNIMIKLKTDIDAIEKYGREKYMMKKDNEDIYIIR